jgi:beta-lactamase regulating signal transducer with metallopeptidase domain
MLPHVEFWILEAAFRSLLMAVAVWAGIRLMRVEAVLAQKVAWVLVLVAAGTMPLVMRTPWLSLDKALRIPIRSVSGNSAPAVQQPVPSGVASPAVIELGSSGSSLGLSLGSGEPNPEASRPYLRYRVPANFAHLSKPVHPGNSGHNPNSDRNPQSRARIVSPAQQLTLMAGAMTLSASSNVLAISTAAGQSSRVQRSTRNSTGNLTGNATGNSTRNWAGTWARIEPMLAMLYLAVGCILLLRMLAGLSIAFRIWLRSQPIANFSEETLPALGVRVLRARVSRDLSTPVTIGPTVILPADYAEWDPAKLRIVLAHEHSHVRQGDFYLQSLAAFHLAIFWFSPLGWWLQRKLSELGEALSDRAGLEQATDPASYAQVLLEFAAMPRTSPFAGAVTGVAMARSNNLSSRIERILNARRFRLAFLGGRHHAVLAATLVPAALVAVIACIRIVPAVEAAQNPPGGGQLIGVVAPAPFAKLIAGPLAGKTSAAVTGVVSGQVLGQVSGQVSGNVTGQVSGQIAGQVISVDDDQAAPPAPESTPAAPALAPVAPLPPSADVAPMQAPEPAPAPQASPDMAPVPPVAPRAARPPRPARPARPARNGMTYAYSDDDDSFAIIHGDDSTVNINGHSGRDLEKARQKYHGNFIWFEHDGKSYVITDPEILDQSEAMFKGDDELNRRMSILDQKEGELNKKMELLQPEMDQARLPRPEFEAKMKKLQEQLAYLQSDKFKKLTDQMSKEFSEEKLGELQEKIGDIQGQIGEIEGQIGEREGLVGEKQGALGEQMGKLGEEMGRIGEQQGRMAEEAARKMKSVFDQAIKDGKAQPVE